MKKTVYVLRYHLPDCSSEFQRTFNTEPEARAFLNNKLKDSDAYAIHFDEVNHLDI